MRKAGVPAEMHIYPAGGHGYGLGIGAAAAWPDLFNQWLRTMELV